MAARMFRQICFHIFRSTDMCTSTFYWWFGLGRFQDALSWKELPLTQRYQSDLGGQGHALNGHRCPCPRHGDMDTKFLEKRGVDMDVDTAWNRCPPYSDTNNLIIPMNLFCGMSKGVFSLVWLAFILFHICLVHFLKKISPLQIRKIPQKRKNNEIELRFTFKMPVK